MLDERQEMNDFSGTSSSRPLPPPASSARQKSVVGSAVLSAMPGLGQVYVGYYKRGFVFLAVVAGTIALLSSGAARGGLEVLAGMFLAFFWIFNMIDASRCAQIYNLAISGASDDELRQSLQVPGAGGGTLIGWILLVLGGLLLLNTAFEIDMRWLEDVWPAGLILLGGYLIWTGRSGRS